MTTLRHRACFAFLALGLGGCWQSTPVNVVAPVGSAATSLGSAQDAQISTLRAEVAQRDTVAASVSGNVYGAKKAKDAIAPDQPAKDAVGQELELASAKLPEPSASDQLAAEKRVTAILTGKLDEAKKLYADASGEAAKFKQQADALNAQIATRDAQIADLQAKAKAEQEANAKAYKTALDAKDAQIKAAKDEAQREIERQQRKWQTAIFFGVGALLTAGGIIVLLTASSVPMFGPRAGFALIGAGGGLIAVGILINQVQNFFDAHPYIVGGTILACIFAAAGACVLMWSNHMHHLETKPSPP